MFSNRDMLVRQIVDPLIDLILPPELMGTHVGSGADHSTGRRLELDFRAGTAIWGRMRPWGRSEADEVVRLTGGPKGGRGWGA